MADYMKREHHMYIFGSEDLLHMENEEAHEDTLMNGHWEELFGKVEELLHATDDPDYYCMYIQAIIQYSSDSWQHFFRLRVIKVMSSSSVSGCTSTLVDFPTTTDEEGKGDISICMELWEWANELSFNC